MTDFGPTRTQPASFFASPVLPAAAFAGVRTRRTMAFFVDFLLVSTMVVLLWIVLLVGTIGLAIFILPPLWPFVAFFYEGFSVAGRHMATPGMRMFDLEMRATDGRPPTFIAAAIHAVLLYASWLFPFVFLASLFMPDKRCLHDVFAGVIVVRRPD